MSQFSQHYERLHDEALMELALRTDLVPEADAALRAELTKRNITDLSAYEKLRLREAISEETHRQKQISRQAKVTGWRSRFLYGMAGLCVVYGLFRLWMPNHNDVGDDGGLFLVLGIGLVLFAWVSSRLSRLWQERVLHRPPAP